MRTLAIVPGEIGDQVLFFPTLSGLKQRYPNAKIDVVAEPRAKDAYHISALVDRVIPFDFQASNTLADWGNLIGTIREQEYDAVFSLAEGVGTGLLLWLTGIPCRIGFDGSNNLYLTGKVPRSIGPIAHKSASANYELLRGIGVRTACPEIAVNVPRKDIEWAEAEQQRLGVKGQNFVLVANEPGNGPGNEADAGQIYPIGQWIVLLKALQSAQPELKIVALGDGLTDWGSTGLGVKVASPTNFGQVTAMAAAASLVVCTESPLLYGAIASQSFTVGLLADEAAQVRLPESDKLLTIAGSDGVKSIDPAAILAKLGG
jgi:ADP-heptose:LPS heptosyltransferase